MAVSVEPTAIPGLLVVRLPVHADARGWFKENWQRAAMIEAGLPDFGPVQNNVAFNTHRGVTRGIHAEPWDKLVSVATGRVFGAWVDLREGASFGACVHVEIGPDVAVFVPRGVGNSYQVLEDATSYVYLVNQHWSPGPRYPALDLADEQAAIPWPIPLDEAEISDKDQHNPSLDDAERFAPRRPVILGAGGMLGRALVAEFPEATALTRSGLDLTDAAAVDAHDWSAYSAIINAAAYTAVDQAETDEGRRSAWQANASAVQRLSEVARMHRLPLVHYSTDYVFDGTHTVHTVAEPHSPLGVYGQSKAAGELAVTGWERHFLLRTSWVVGHGPNFVRTMLRLARDGVDPQVVDDQFGRLAFTDELARATRHLLAGAEYGTYHCTQDGPAQSWAQLAASIFEMAGTDPGRVSAVSTAAYLAGKSGVAPRPTHSELDLAPLIATGYQPAPMAEALRAYVAAQS